MTLLSKRIVEIISLIPKGKVLTYGSVSILTGSPNSSRLVSWLLHSKSKDLNLPWHRVVNKYGKISLKNIDDYLYQKKLLEDEGIVFINETIDLDIYLWDGIYI